MDNKKAETTPTQTVYYGDDDGRLFMARHAYEQFLIDRETDPSKARVLLVSRIQSALGQAFAQGVNASKTVER